tara:strand:- start:311 stop:955 length:645 start_codon:yes stop_codon:yes gene_type:complete
MTENKIILKTASSKSFYNISKRLFDFLFAVIAIIALSPFLFVIGLLVKITSAGPIFYRGERIGFKGKSFKIFKFRSMFLGSDKGPGTTSKSDARVTLIGGFIRKYKLDELPQLINIIIGDMSFVGPRPELKRYTDLYNEEEKIILSVRPGITDFSSLHFSNLNELIDDKDPDYSFEKYILPQKNRLRIEYIKKRNFWLDLALIFKTITRLAGLK